MFSIVARRACFNSRSSPGFSTCFQYTRVKRDLHKCQKRPTQVSTQQSRPGFSTCFQAMCC